MDPWNHTIFAEELPQFFSLPPFSSNASHMGNRVGEVDENQRKAYSTLMHPPPIFIDFSFFLTKDS